MKNFSELSDTQLAIIWYSVSYLMDSFEENEKEKDAIEIIESVEKEISKRNTGFHTTAAWVTKQLQ